MAYDDFIYFMLSEEDKGSEARCVCSDHKGPPHHTLNLALLLAIHEVSSGRT